MKHHACAVFAISAVLGALPLAAQSVISARAGLIHYVEGRVLLADKPVEVRSATFPEIKEGVDLRTEDGRAEVLLNPGVFLRVRENSAVRMIIARLSDTRVEFLSGSILVESNHQLSEKDNSVTIIYQGATVQLRKSGIYRFESEPAQLRVYAGEADVKAVSNFLTVKQGKLLPLPDGVAVEKFDTRNGDAFSRWSKRRAEYIAVANISAAKSVGDSGNTWRRSGWLFNPYFGMFTFIPGAGHLWSSPYGYRFYCPRTVYRVFEAPMVAGGSWSGGGPHYNSNLGYQTMPQTSSGYSGTVAAARPSAAAPTTTGAGAASAPISRDSGAGGGRER